MEFLNMLIFSNKLIIIKNNNCLFIKLKHVETQIVVQKIFRDYIWRQNLPKSLLQCRCNTNFLTNLIFIVCKIISCNIVSFHVCLKYMKTSNNNCFIQLKGKLKNLFLTPYFINFYIKTST